MYMTGSDVECTYTNKELSLSERIDFLHNPFYEVLVLKLYIILL